MIKKRGEIVISEGIAWAIGIAILVIAFIALYYLFKTGSGAGEFIKNLFRFKS